MEQYNENWLQEQNGVGFKPTLLVSMVKNEQHNIVHMLQSAIDARVITHVLLCDTGSQDSTVDTANAFLNNTNIDYDIVQYGWENFADSRNQCLEHAKQLYKRWNISWILFLDADHRVQSNVAKLSLEPKEQVNLIDIHEPGNVRNELPYLIHSTSLARDCAYVCKTHEILHCPTSTKGKYTGLKVLHKSNGKSSFELQRDATILRHAISNMTGDNCPVTRYYFYYAFTLFNMANYTGAIEWHNKRLEHAGWYQERWYSMYQLAVATYLGNNANITTVQELFLNTLKAPGGAYRREPLYYLARLYRESGAYVMCHIYSSASSLSIPYEESPLFIDHMLSGWALQEEHALCLYYMGYNELAHAWFERILKLSPHLNAIDRKRIQKSEQISSIKNTGKTG